MLVTVILAIQTILEIFSIKYGLNWCDANNSLEQQSVSGFVKFVLKLRILTLILQICSNLLTWVNQKYLETYMLSSPFTNFSFILIVSAWFYSYATSKMLYLAGEELESSSDEFSPVNVTQILGESQLSFISNLVLVGILVCINQAI